MSTAWTTTTLSDSEADLVFSAQKGVGLSLIRIHINSDGTTGEANPAMQAQARGATVWASPWTPAPAYKSNNNAIAGTLTNGQAWANSLANFVKSMKTKGINIYAISAQNEPDASVNYDSCSYTGQTLASFMGTYLGPALQGSGAKMMGPETQNWCQFPNYEPAIMKDANASKYTSIIATHEYGCSPKAYPEIQQAGKEFWETEIYDSTCTAADVGMTSGLRVAKLIHDALTIANMNAWHYWHLHASGGGNCAALYDFDSGSPAKRLYVMGNFSKFVRPGYHRVGTAGKVPAGVLLTAYTNPADGSVAIVAINNNTSATALSVFLSSGAPCSVTPWVTSSSDSLVAKATVPVASSRFTYTLGAQSVTTFVGKP